MAKTYVFTSYELYPINAGGCGVFIYNAMLQLLQNTDNRVVLLLDMPKHECDLYAVEHQPRLPNSQNLTIICLSEWIVGEPSGEKFANIFLQKSYRFYRGLLKLCQSRQVDFIEFFDYVGIGYFSVKAKQFEGHFPNTILGVRAHCTIDLMDLEQVPNSFDLYKLQMYQMEKEVIQDIDVLLVPSNAWGELYTKRYGVSSEKVVVSPPPVELWNDVTYSVNEGQKNVLFYGRIFQLKGVDLFVDAAIALMIKRPENDSIFYLVGYDGLDLNGEPYKSQLLSRIPEHLRDRFVFTGQLNHQKLQELLKTICFAVFPNYVESFCYSIHELYNVGVPIIANNIPAFRDYFVHDKNALIYQGSSSELVLQMERMFESYQLRLNMSLPYKVINNKQFNEIYDGVVTNRPNNIGNNKTSILDNREELLCSLVILNEGQNDQFESTNLVNHTKVDKQKSYILKLEPPGTPVHFLGKLRYARRLDGSIDDLLPINQFVLTCYCDDKIDDDYITRALNIFESNDSIQYVGAQLKNTDQYEQINLLEPYTYRNYTRLTRAILKLDSYSKSIRDVYDIRLQELGEKKFFQQKGYIIPNELISIGIEHTLTSQDENYIYSTHYSTRSNDWNPYVLYPYLIKNNTQVDLREVSYSTFDSIARKIYHKLKHKVDATSGKKGKVAGRILKIVHRQVKKRI
ncbi:hypothetical protein A8L34_24735 [Bacillus sp. FJAT-27264]|uniref:glycosyltransferase family 4 protein n=1 Tax=Paenibacillus sp. (strain DSM 101736 / FJAT-27264) TaxID=1850362 RepID=UPI000807F60B|nr:glycosyltransferase family 4 protein [Bacillus sp. FJAT-27264]OBZ07842.1 hypothetical protein A8L34_24735 [Bacillus sp. FJAT-27264]